MIIDVYNKWSGPCNAMNSLLKKMRVQFQVRKIVILLLSIHYEPIMGTQKYLFCGFFQPFKKKPDIYKGNNGYKTSVNKFKTPKHHRLLKSDFGDFLFL